jgi:pimeloyl-ACP methyl ester carboxylesterase
VGSIRFDKVGSGANMAGLELLSLAHYREEIGLAAAALRSQTGCERIFVLGNSEGSLHAFGYGAEAQGEPWWGGVISLAGPSRRIIDLVVEQYTAALAPMTEAQRLQLEGFRDAVMALAPGKPIVAPDLSLLPGAAGIWAQLEHPSAADVARDLMQADPLESVRAYRGPALVISSDRDIQVPLSDGDAIAGALPARDTTRRLVLAEANHVFKHETRSVDTGPSLALAYAEEGRPLAPGLIDALVSFMTVAGRD